MKQRLELKVNGEIRETYVEPWWTLADVLRDELALTGTKIGCETGHCGTCTVLINGKAVKSCLILAHQAKGKDITTIEGLAKNGKFHPVQQAFIDHFAVQCGFCSPGMIMSATALLDEKPNPIEEEIRVAIAGNLCRCTGYVKIAEAIMAARDNLLADKKG